MFEGWKKGCLGNFSIRSLPKIGLMVASSSSETGGEDKADDALSWKRFDGYRRKAQE
jgi:hypothetical protein